jgi:tape measure domain-containing protein
MAEDVSFKVSLVDQVSKAAKAVRSSLMGVDSSFARAAKSARQAGSGKGMGSLGKVGDGIGSSLGALAPIGAAAFSAIATGAVAGAAAVTAASVAIGTLTVQAAMFGQESKLALGNLLHGGEDANAVFADITKTAAGLGLDVKGTTKDFQKLLAAQFSVGASKEIIKMGSDLRGIGVDAEGVSSVIRAMTQIKSKGKLQGEELMQLQEAGVSGELVFQALEKSLGKTRSEVQKLMSAGKIDSALGLEAIQEAIKVKTGVSEFGELGKKFADTTLMGMAGKLKGGFDNMFTAAGEKVLPILEKTLGPIAKEVMGFFEGEGGSDFIDGIASAFETVGEVINTIIPIGKMFFSGLSGPIGDLMFGMKGVGGGFKAAFTNPAFLESVKQIGTFVGKLVVGAIALAGGLLRLVPVITQVTSFMTRWFQVGMTIVNLPLLMTGAMVAVVALMGKLGLDIVKGLASGIASAASWVIAAVKGLGSLVISGIKAILGIGSPSKVMAKQGMFTSVGFAKGIRAGIPLISRAANEVASAASIPRVAAPANDMAVTGAEASFARAGGSIGAAGGSTNTSSIGNITVNVQVPEGTSDPRKFGEIVGQSIRNQLESAMASMSPAAA